MFKLAKHSVRSIKEVQHKSSLLLATSLKNSVQITSRTIGSSYYNYSTQSNQLLNSHVYKTNNCDKERHILDRRNLSPNEQIMLTPSLKKYGNGLVFRVAHIKIEKAFNFDGVLRRAVDRVQKGQPLLRSRIIRNPKGSKLAFSFELMDDQYLPLIPIVNLEGEMKEFEKNENPMQEYIEQVLTQKSYDLEKDFQLELYYYMNGNDLYLIVRYNHSIGDGISISNFIGQVLRECENVSMERETEQVEIKKLLASTDEIIMDSRLNSFSAKWKSLKYAFPFIKEMIFNKPNQYLIQFDRRHEHKTVSMVKLEFEGDTLKHFRNFTKQHGVSINSCLIPLLSLAYLKAAREHDKNPLHPNSCVRVGYPTGLSKIPHLSQVLDGNTLSLHVGVFIEDLKFDSCYDVKKTIVSHAKQILSNHAANFENQFILTNVLQSPLTRETAMAKTLENNDVFLAGLPVNFIVTNNGQLDSVKRSYQLSSTPLTIHSMYTIANTSALAGCLACGALTLPPNEKHSAKLIISLSCMEPIISRDALHSIQRNLQELFETLFTFSD
ncbi:predicted protein [Naegleria gruberi]|uniref:Predicted protein n=1 Tax=Naegleria gruberi TaxID=5762 RepID=D2V4A7_NAEGR|nr:uncharacterized protein NAEGRDRAFT_63657 [Naegleria gruberi]EFC48484.1 predicted protein [Naegleria gruberi]|eukprot:XP_002681228.1 predicted protein [Naegleria gruberi strain NEG-M]